MIFYVDWRNCELNVFLWFTDCRGSRLNACLIVFNPV